MKKIIIIIIAVSIVVFIYTRARTKADAVQVDGYCGVVTDVEKGNILILNTGLKVWMLGVEPERSRAEVWIKNNLIGQMVELVSDSRNEKSFSTVGSTIKAYVIIERDGKKVCANRLLIEDNRDCYTLAYMADSVFVSSDPITTVINDKALYMKQRTMIVRTASGLGTAFFINDKGVALTNNHVLNGQESACVFLYAQDVEDSKVYSSRRRRINGIYKTNAELDITVFQVELQEGDDVPYFNLIKQHEPQGNECFILGNPQGLMASFAKGVISAYRDDDEVDGRKLVQYDIATNGGNSGGPVMNTKGEIIAVHSMGRKEQSNGAAAQGLNFGIDILQVRQFLDNYCPNVDYGGK